MVRHIKKHLISIAIVLATSVAYSHTSTAQTVLEVINALQSKKALRGATIGFYAINFTQDTVIGSHNANTSIIPASSLKVLTTATALEVLGPNHRFETHLQYDGHVDEHGTLHGNIYIRGGGDPMLGSIRFKRHYYQPHFIDSWVKAIQAKGIKKIAGKVIGDASIYADSIVPDTWVAGDLGMYYGAMVSGLSIFDNTFSVTLKAPGKGQTASLVATNPALPPDVQLILQVQGDDVNHASLHNSGYPYMPTRIIKGKIPYTPKTSRTIVTIPDAPYWAAYTLHQALQQQGIETTQSATTVRRNGQDVLPRNHLHTTYSPPLSELIKAINIDSVNSYAEHLVKYLGRILAGEASTQKGVKAIRKFWAERGLDVNGMLLYDGSGLSRYNAVTPRQLVEVMAYMKNSHHFSVFYDSLPIAGKTGGFIHPILRKPPLYGRLRIKPGKLSKCRTFTGYGKNDRGEDIAFSVFIVSYDGCKSANKALEQILVAMMQQERVKES